jgi:hypothetical protein
MAPCENLAVLGPQKGSASPSCEVLHVDSWSRFPDRANRGFDNVAVQQDPHLARFPFSPDLAAALPGFMARWAAS